MEAEEEEEAGLAVSGVEEVDGKAGEAGILV